VLNTDLTDVTIVIVIIHLVSLYFGITLILDGLYCDRIFHANYKTFKDRLSEDPIVNERLYEIYKEVSWLSGKTELKPLK